MFQSQRRDRDRKGGNRVRKVVMVVFFILVAGTISLVVTAPGANDMPKAAAVFTASGELVLPDNYREWIFVGAPVTPNDMNQGAAAFPEFHDVYIDRAAYAVYKRTGEFPEGTVFVKELVSVGAKNASSGNGYFPGKPGGVAASVKDTSRFGGDRHGWGYFDFGTDKKTAKVMSAAACNACHKAGPTEDMVFTQFYPVLGAAKAEAMKKPVVGGSTY